jgi:hypothetical protein
MTNHYCEVKGPWKIIHLYMELHRVSTRCGGVSYQLTWGVRTNTWIDCWRPHLGVFPILCHGLSPKYMIYLSSYCALYYLERTALNSYSGPPKYIHYIITVCIYIVVSRYVWNSNKIVAHKMEIGNKCDCTYMSYVSRFLNTTFGWHVKY